MNKTWERYLLREGYVLNGDFHEQDIATFFSLLKQYSGHTWIFFDTETTGFDPKQNQLTEVAAVAAQAQDWQFSSLPVKPFHDKIKLSDETRNHLSQPVEPGEQDPRYPLSLTRYGMNKRDYQKMFNRKTMPEEQEVVEGFISFITSFDKPLLVAQNAKFDVDFIQARANKYNIPLQLSEYDIFDTMMVIKLFHNPLIHTMAEQGDQRAQKILQLLQKQGKFGTYTSSSMGVVSQAYEIDIDDWHNALADVKMMMKMLQEVFFALQKSNNTDISKHHNKVVRGIRWKQQKDKQRGNQNG